MSLKHTQYIFINVTMLHFVYLLHVQLHNIVRRPQKYLLMQTLTLTSISMYTQREGIHMYMYEYM